MGSSRRVVAMSRLFALTAVGLCIIASRADSADIGTSFRRGIGISHAMAWARIDSVTRDFAFPPFSEPGTALTRTELQTLRRTGFDFVRFAVDPGPFLQFQGLRREALDDILLDCVTRILAARLSVVVDFHPSDLHPDYTTRALTAGLNTPLYQSYLRMLERTARLLDRLHSHKVAIELMNEPPRPPDVWQPMLEAAYAAVRRGSTNLPVVLDGGQEASATALLAMRTAAFAQDPAVLFSFHYYDPYQFTHQGASWNDARYLADVPYPALARSAADSLQATATAIGETNLDEDQKSSAYRDARNRLESYRRSGFDGNAIANSFEQIANWARSQGVAPDRIMLGEFGARKTDLQFSGSRHAERAQWFHDVREQAEVHGFGWAVWAYRGSGGFALARGETSDDIEPSIARALGLTTSSRAGAAAPALDTSQARP